jgi:hypothetical protein
VFFEEGEMSDVTYTPGPWGVEQTLEHNWIGPMRHNGKVDQIVCHTEREGLKDSIIARNDANAQLIASAPDLLRERDQLKAELATLKIGTNSALAVIISERDEAKAELAGIRQALQTEYRSPIGDEDILDLMGNFIDHHKEKESELAQARAHNAALLEACKEIAKGEGDFHRDPLVHAENTIQNMKQLARAAIALEKGEKL